MNAVVGQETDTSVPDDLESPRAKLVYFYFATRGAATADDLCETLDLKKGTALPIIGTLRERGYVERVDGRYQLS